MLPQDRLFGMRPRKISMCSMWMAVDLKSLAGRDLGAYSGVEEAAGLWDSQVA